MKKTAIFGLFVGLLLPLTSFGAFDTTVKYGSKGSAVVEMQEFLIDQGFMSGQATGNFYSLTLKAVKAFQLKEGITPVSGLWGPLTRAKANTYIDLSESDAEEVSVGMVTPQKSDFEKLLEIMAQFKTDQANQSAALQAQNVQLQAQLAAQIQATQQVAQNTAQQTPTPKEKIISIYSGTYNWGNGKSYIYARFKNDSDERAYLSGVNYSATLDIGNYTYNPNGVPLEVRVNDSNTSSYSTLPLNNTSGSLTFSNIIPVEPGAILKIDLIFSDLVLSSTVAPIVSGFTTSQITVNK